MSRLTLLALSLALAHPVAARSAVTLEILPPSLATDVSADGSVIVGNMPDNYETFRWTAGSGVIRLGRSSLDKIGKAAGLPGVSSDGSRICASIISDDRTYMTQGVWTARQGWQECTPLPPDGGILDLETGSAWGISDDGLTVVGLYWRPGQPGGSAHASSWTESAGMIDLGSTGGSSRANAVSADGSVVVGWAEEPTGAWQPTVWRNGILTTLNPSEAFCEAAGVTPDGTLVTGSTWDGATFTRVAATWKWNGSTWTETALGVLPGTRLGDGQAIAQDASSSGDVVVGYNATRNFGGEQTGFIWTSTTGMIDVEKLLRFFGYDIGSRFDIQSLVAISDDGRTLVGYGYDVGAPFAGRTFIVRTGNLSQALDQYTASRGTAERSTSRTLASTHASDAVVDLDIFDCSGKRVDVVSRVLHTSTGYALPWTGVTRTGERVRRGVYFARPAAGRIGPTQRIVITH